LLKVISALGEVSEISALAISTLAAAQG